MITTTLSRIHEHAPCREGWKKLLKHLGKTKANDEPLPFVTILDSNGLDDCLWCLRAEPQHEKLWRDYARWCARQVIHLWDAPDVVVKYLATGDKSLRDAAWDASEDARAVRAVRAVRAARDAAWAAMAARDAAMDARDARDAAWAAWDATLDARAAARDAITDLTARQESALRQLLETGDSEFLNVDASDDE